MLDTKHSSAEKIDGWSRFNKSSCEQVVFSLGSLRLIVFRRNRDCSGEKVIPFALCILGSFIFTCKALTVNGGEAALVAFSDTCPFFRHELIVGAFSRS